jgi:tetratricopeptide (TPR) repeat protein
MRDVSSIVICFLTITIGCTGPQGYVKKADSLFKKGAYVEAALNYRKALQKDPNLGEAHYQLALCELKNANPANALTELNQATRLMPRHEASRIQLGDLAITAYAADRRRPKALYEQAQKSADELLAINPHSSDGYRLKGYIALADGRPVQAIELLQKADSARPGQLTVRTVLVEALIKNGQSAEAEKLALTLIGRHKNYGPLYDLLYRYYVSAGREGEAGRLIEQWATENPDQSAPLLTLAAHYYRNGKPAEAERPLQKLLQSGIGQAHQLVGDFYARANNFQRALEYYETGLKQPSGDRVTYQKKIAASYAALNQYDQAIAVLETVLKDHPQDGDALRLYAVQLVETNRPENIDKAIELYTGLIKNNSLDLNLRYQLGRAYMARRDYAKAKHHFQEASRQQNDFVLSWIGLSQLSRLQENWTDTMIYAKDALAINPNSLEARFLYAVGLAGMNNHAEAAREFKNLLKLSPNSVDVQIQLGLLDVATKRYREAEATFRRLLNLRKRDLRPFIALVQLYQVERQPNRAVAILNDALKLDPEFDALRALLANAAAAAGSLDMAIQQYEQLILKNPLSAEYHSQLGQIYRWKGDFDKSLSHFSRAQQLAPNTESVQAAIAYAQDMSGRQVEAKASYRKALEADPTNSIVLNNLAFLMAETNDDLDGALKLIQQALKNEPGSPYYLDTLGVIYLKKKLPDSALRVFGELVRRHPDAVAARYQMAVAYFEKGNSDKAKSELRIALSKNPSKEQRERINELLKKIG